MVGYTITQKTPGRVFGKGVSFVDARPEFFGDEAAKQRDIVA